MQKKIKIECQGAAFLDYKDLEPFQGGLKNLHKDDYEKLRAIIIEDGFSDPINVWRNKGKNYVISGHQRLRVVKNMVEEEGWSCPPLPISIVDAKDIQQAKRKVLAMASQYGKIEKQGLYEFVHAAGIEAEELVKDFKLPEIDLPTFIEEFYDVEKDPLDVSGMESGSDETGTGRVHSDGVKMVQLFFGAEDHKKFEKAVEMLKDRHDKDNVSDAVLIGLNLALGL